MHQFIKFILFWNDKLHVSDDLSAHHQEFKTVHTATGISQTDTAVCMLAGTRWNRYQADSSICLTNTCSCMYGLELLMMDGKIV